MLIPTSDIMDWKDLQNKIAQTFREMGYKVTTESIDAPLATRTSMTQPIGPGKTLIGTCSSAANLMARMKLCIPQAQNSPFLYLNGCPL